MRLCKSVGPKTINDDLPWIVAIRLRSMLSLKLSSLGPMIARISSSSLEWLRAESKLPAEALNNDEESSGERLRNDMRSRLDARMLLVSQHASRSSSSWLCWDDSEVLCCLCSCWRTRRLGGSGGGVPPNELLLSSERQRFLKIYSSLLLIKANLIGFNKLKNFLLSEFI